VIDMSQPNEPKDNSAAQTNAPGGQGPQGARTSAARPQRSGSQSASSGADAGRVSPGSTSYDRTHGGDDIKSEMDQLHRLRTSVPGVEGADARLDNRQASELPGEEAYADKPQHVDGPGVKEQFEHTREVLAGRRQERADRDDSDKTDKSDREA
jgi:hypothetical protein